MWSSLLISVIADISLDHQKYLGDTIAEIAREKAGIIRQKGVVVTLPQHPQANDVIGHAIEDKAARGVSAAKYVPPVSPGAAAYLAGQKTNLPGRSRYPLAVMGEEIEVDSPLVGRHQLRNIALAIATAVELNHFGFKVTPKQIEQGIRETHWPGRFQVLPPSAATDQREMVLDVAHNPAGAWALRSALSENFPERGVDARVRGDAGQGHPGDRGDPISHCRASRGDAGRTIRAPQPRRNCVQAASRTGALLFCGGNVPAALARAREISKRGRGDRGDRIDLPGRRSDGGDGDCGRRQKRRLSPRRHGEHREDVYRNPELSCLRVSW